MADTRIGVLLVALSLLLPSYGLAQCSPTASCSPVPAVMAYRSAAFHIPRVWPFSDGSGMRTKDDCEALQSRFENESGRGVVTDAVQEFVTTLEKECAKENGSGDEWEEAVNGDLCLFQWSVFSRAVPLNTPGDFCKRYISFIKVIAEKIVIVAFDDPEIPCYRSRQRRLQFCVGEYGPYSPDSAGG